MVTRIHRTGNFRFGGIPLLVRKIEKAKWMQNDILNGEEVSADAITNCTRTNKNKLSLWFIQDESNLDDAVLALTSQAQHLETIDTVSYTHLRAHETDSYLVCRLLLEKKKK